MFQIKKQQQKQHQPQKKRTRVIVKDASGYERSRFVYVCVSVFIIYFDLFFFYAEYSTVCLQRSPVLYRSQVCVVADQTVLFQFLSPLSTLSLGLLSGSIKFPTILVVQLNHMCLSVMPTGAFALKYSIGQGRSNPHLRRSKGMSELDFSFS